MKSGSTEARFQNKSANTSRRSHAFETKQRIGDSYFDTGQSRSITYFNSPSSTSRINSEKKRRQGPPRPQQSKRYISSRAGSNSPSAKISSKSNYVKREALNPRQREAQKKYLFQNPSYVSTFSTNTVEILNRTAFERISPFSPELLQLSNLPKQQQRKSTPALQHVQALDRIYKRHRVRQLAWSSAASKDASLSTVESDDNTEMRVSDHNDILTPAHSDSYRKKRRQWKRKRTRKNHMTMYTPVDRIQHLNTLPPHNPQLTNVKQRLPMRSDVGFPHATDDEIKTKQNEIQREAELEESSPRLALLVSQDMIVSRQENASINPFFEQMLNDLGNIKNVKPNPTSTFAPPIDATPSSTYGWKSRPFWDRPPGMKYIVASPLSINFDFGDLEPLVCSMALYHIPPKNANSNETICQGKISEDFIFPAGDWKGLLQEKARNKLASEFRKVFSNNKNDHKIGTLHENKKQINDIDDDCNFDSSNDSNDDVFQKNKKALFSYDPNALSPSPSNFLFLVIQVHKVTQPDATKTYQSLRTDNKRTVQSNIKSSFTPTKNKLFTKPRIFSKKNTPVKDKESMRVSATHIFKSFGTQFLTPIAFGISSIFGEDFDKNNNSFVWPNGKIQSMQLFSFPDQPESEEKFVFRLSNIIEESKRFNAKSLSQILDTPTNNSPTDDDSSLLSIRSYDSPRPTRKLFNKQSTKKKYAEIPQDYGSLPPLSDLNFSGNAKLFTSSIGIDFTQALLQTPEPLISAPPPEPMQKNLNPKLLVDVTGDCAIMLNPTGQESRKATRADLSSLSPSRIPSEYSDSSDVREILYLPPRTSKKYDNYVPASSFSFMNLLFLYPRLLRLVPDNNTKGNISSSDKKFFSKTKYYSVRIRLMQQGSGKDPAKILDSIYNPAPGGNILLKALFTKIPNGFGDKKNGALVDSLRQGMPMRDEVKLRLPLVLNGEHFLHFSLFGVGVPMNHENRSELYTVELIAENFIPLSCLKDSSSGKKVATVIPNATHRIKLGTFQLLLETRLVSSIHVCDPEVATILRDFPCGLDASNGRIEQGISNSIKKLNLVSNTSLSSKPQTLPHFAEIVANASEHTVVNHFNVLLFMHVWNLVSHGTPALYFLNEEHNFISKNSLNNDNKNRKRDLESSHFYEMHSSMMSMLEIIRKVKVKFVSVDTRNLKKLEFFLKFFLDSFDESSFHDNDNLYLSSSMSVDSYLDTNASSKSTDLSDRSMSSKKLSFNQNDKDIEPLYKTVIAILEEKIFESAVDIITQQNLETEQLYSTNQFTHNSSYHRDAPFSRKAYGVTKTERMRAEAELNEVNRYARVFDDDETIFTVDTLKSRDHHYNGESQFDELVHLQSYNDGEKHYEKTQNHNQIPTKPLKMSPKSSSNERRKGMNKKFPSMTSFVGENNFAKRVNSVAQVMIAPCMGPSLPNALATGNTRVVKYGKPKSALISAYKERMEKQAVRMNKVSEIGSERSIFSPGSDVDDETFFDGTVPLLPQQPYDNKWVHPETSIKSKLRGIHLDHHDMQLAFSFPSECSSSTDGALNSEKEKPFLYECIMSLWLLTWVENAPSKEYDFNLKERKKLNTNFILHKNEFPQLQASAVYSFNSNIDFLLPLCLKSLALRCSQSMKSWQIIPQTILDKRHMQVLKLIIQICAYGLIHQSLDSETDDQDGDTLIMSVVSSSDAVLDFLVGLMAIIHPAQVFILLRTYFETLKSFDLIKDDNKVVRSSDKEQKTSLNVEEKVLQLKREKCSVQLRLRAIEVITKLPNFVPLNFPLKCNNVSSQKQKYVKSWMKQNHDINNYETLESNLYNDPDGLERLPHANWLANLIADEGFLICKNSCAAMMNELSISEPNYQSKNLDFQEILQEKRLHSESTAVQSITYIHELLIRRHFMDKRFQSDTGRKRLSGIFIHSVFENSINNVEMLASMKASHKVRLLWLLCLLYLLQEAPENIIRYYLRRFCLSKVENKLKKFIKLLKLCSFSFQSFIVKQHESVNMNLNSTKDRNENSWIVQESYNIICATIITLVDECATSTLSSPIERKDLAQDVFDLILNIASTPQSSVTLLRALGGASHAFDKFGAALFIDAVGDQLQHWGRILLTLMNSTALSVRSIAVDFTVSIFGRNFEEYGNVDELALVFLTVMPEVVAREIGMYSVSNNLNSMFDVESSLWPLRRALADVEETNPQDDDRVDVQLVPILSSFCRTCQAVIDGVVIELGLMKKDGDDILQNTIGRQNNNSKKNLNPLQHHKSDHTFDADEESLFEAANFFQPETAPLQRIRWLITLKSLHEYKGQWVEAAETLLLCARTIADSIPHIKRVWRPSRFAQWHDTQSSIWLSTLGGKMNSQDANVGLMKFASKFLEPPNLLGLSNPTIKTSGKLFSPTISLMCKMLTRVSKESVLCFLEEGLESLALLRLEKLLKRVMDVVEDHTNFSSNSFCSRGTRNLLVEESAALRKMSASLNGDMTKLAERMLLIAEEEPEGMYMKLKTDHRLNGEDDISHQFYVRVILLGNKPERFKESTAIPTFLEWGSPSICRVRKSAIIRAFDEDKMTTNKNLKSLENKLSPIPVGRRVCEEFAKPIVEALAKELSSESIILSEEIPSESTLNDDAKITYVVVTLVQMQPLLRGNGQEDVVSGGGSKRFYFRSQFSTTHNTGSNTNLKAGFVELTVANTFPCCLSRQRTIITSEYFS